VCVRVFVCVCVCVCLGVGERESMFAIYHCEGTVKFTGRCVCVRV